MLHLGLYVWYFAAGEELMETPYRSRWAGFTIRTSILVFGILLFYFSVRAYSSEQLLVLAEGGRKTVSDYELLLVRAVKSNPWNGPARLRLSDLYMSQQNSQKAIAVLNSTSPGRNHWKGWERLGAVYDRMAFLPDGTDADVERTRSYYDAVLRVYPTYERGLERRALLALKLGEWQEVEAYTSRLQDLDANNQNVVYMRGRAAEALGREDIAYQLFTQLSAAGEVSTSSLYTKEDVINRLSAHNRQIK